MAFFDKRNLWWFLLLLPAVMIVTGIILTDIPSPDMAHRYIPMAEAFAQGDWEYAFHPRIPPLQIICGGIIAFLTGLDGFLSLKIASALWFIAGGAILYFMLRELYEDKKYIAVMSLAFYFLHPYSFQFAVSGLRESAKGTLLILIAWGLIRIFRCPERRSGYWMLTSACALGIICRVDMMLTSLLCFTVGTTFEWRHKKFPWISFYLSSILVVVLLGTSLLNSLTPGAMLPECRMVEIFTKIFHRQPGFTDALIFSLAAVAGMLAGAWIFKIMAKYFTFARIVILIIAAVTIVSVKSALTAKDPDCWGFISELIKGFYQFAGAFEIVIMIVLAFRKKLTPPEKILIFIVLINAAVNIISMLLTIDMLFITSRYMTPPLPLWAPFFVIGVKMIYDLVDKFVPRWLTNTLLVLSCTAIAGGLIYHMYQPALRLRTRHRQKEYRNAILDIAAFISRDYRGKKENRVKQHISRYQSKKYPKLFFTEPTVVSVSACLAGGSRTLNKKEAHYIIGTKPPAKAKVIMTTDGKYKRFYIWRTKR